MRITPLELRSHRFARRLNGLDPEEVAAFLEMVAEDFESLTRENESLNECAYQLEKKVAELSSDQKLLQETLISAQAMSQDLRQTAVKESEVLLSEAELRAEKIVDAGHRRSARLAEEIREMHQIRTRLAASLRACIDTHLRIIDSLETAPEPELVDAPRVAYSARSQTPGPGSRAALSADD